MRKLLTLCLVLSIQAMPHEGHDHDGPSTLQPLKGGVIKSLESSAVEVVSKGKELEIYFFDKDGKPEEASKFKVTAYAQLPRTKKKEKVPLVPKEKWLEGTYDGKGTHRYTLILEIKPPNEDHADKVNFTIEPKK